MICSIISLSGYGTVIFGSCAVSHISVSFKNSFTVFPSYSIFVYCPLRIYVNILFRINYCICFDFCSVRSKPTCESKAFLCRCGKHSVCYAVCYLNGSFKRNCILFIIKLIETDIINSQLITYCISIKSDFNKCRSCTCSKTDIRLCFSSLPCQRNIYITFPVCTVCCVGNCTCFACIICIQCMNINIITA